MKSGRSVEVRLFCKESKEDAMTLKVNKTRWDSLSEAQREHVRTILVRAQVIGEEETILPDPETPVPAVKRDDFPPFWDLPDDCVDACWLAAELTNAQCLAAGGNEIMCGLAAQAVFRQCCEACA
jgi:hypothetical protein